MLQVLDWYGTEIEEYGVRSSVLQDLNRSRLRAADLDEILTLEPVRPMRWHEYIYAVTAATRSAFADVRRASPALLPLAVFDARIGDLVLRFREDPDDALHKGYRRLEDAVRERTRLHGESGSSLMSRAFQGDSSHLHWPRIGSTEQKGRGNLFAGAFMAFRNRRAHRELPVDEDQAVREFLLLNELFRLEAESVQRIVTGEGG